MKEPMIHGNTFVAPDASVYGDVQVKEGSSIWFHATVRADWAAVMIGKDSNIQDNAVVHVDRGFGVKIGNGVTIGHSAVIHGCTIGDNTLVGMGAILLNGAVIGRNCIIGAGALVTQNTVVPDNMMVMGSPARVKRQVLDHEIEANRVNAQHYVIEGKSYAEYFREKELSHDK